MTSCEKLRYIMCEGEKALAPQKRSPPLLLFLKSARVEYHPVGVVGIIIPWVSFCTSYFHDILAFLALSLFSVFCLSYSSSIPSFSFHPGRAIAPVGFATRCLKDSLALHFLISLELPIP